MPYSQTVLDNFFNPFNAYRMDKPNKVGKAGNPDNGPFMILFLKLGFGKIMEASFQTYGCEPAIAAGSVLTRHITSMPIYGAKLIDIQAILNLLDGLPENKRHCAQLAVDALKDALR